MEVILALIIYIPYFLFTQYWYYIVPSIILLIIFLKWLDNNSSGKIISVYTHSDEEYKPTKFTESSRYYSEYDSCDHEFTVYYNAPGGGEKRKCNKCGKIDKSYYIPPH